MKDDTNIQFYLDSINTRTTAPYINYAKPDSGISGEITKFIKSDTLIITDLKPKGNHEILQGRLTLIDADGLRYGTSALFHRNHREWNWQYNKL